MPEVSVCCATYNHGKYIEQTLKSFVNQKTTFTFEIIVHEDVSTDNTREIVRKYADMYPQLIVPIFQEENQYSKGKGIILHNMFSKARGKYIALCEGDDYWIDEYKLQKQYDIMERQPDCSICVHNKKLLFEDRNIIEKYNKDAKGIANQYDLNVGVIDSRKMAKALWMDGGYPFHTSSYFIRKDVLQPLIEYENEMVKSMNGDMTLLRLCLAKGNFYYMDEFMSCRRMGVSGSWSARWALRTPKERAEHYLEQAKGEMLFDEYSELRFHEYIQRQVINLIAEACIYHTEGIKVCLKDVHYHVSDVKERETLWLYIRYCIMKISPKLYKKMNDIKKTKKSN